jgi:hypothetical protein
MPAFGWNRRAFGARNLAAWFIPVPGIPPTFVEIITGRRCTIVTSGGTNPSYVVDPVMGPCIDFPAASNYYELLGLPAGVSGAVAFPVTVTAWIRPYNTAAGARGIAGICEPNSDHALWIDQSAATARMRASDGNATTSIATSSVLATNVWSLIAGRATSATSRAVYHKTTSVGSSTSRVIDTLDRTLIGIQASLRIEPYRGRIAEVRFYRSEWTSIRTQNLTLNPTAFDLYNWGRHPIGGGAAAVDRPPGWIHEPATAMKAIKQRSERQSALYRKVV